MIKRKKYTIWLALAATLACSPAAYSTTCLSVTGKVKTTNLNDITQSGTIKITLTDSNGDDVYSSKGALVGTITGAAGYTITLSHTANLKDGNDFITSGDIAIITGIRDVSDEGLPCSFYVEEHITQISSETGFFANIESAHIVADGFTSTCLPEENVNKFELSGDICVD